MVISMVLVGVALVGALNAVGASKLARFKVSVSRQGHLLAQDLMTEILLQDYADCVDGLDSFGLSAAETATGDRSLFDDVDDYDGWSSSPPEYKDGTEIANLDSWERSVAVVWADPSDISQVVGSNQGVKRITVTVRHNDVPAAELVVLKTIGLPPLEACCFDDGSCHDLRIEACATEGGTSMGPETNCATTECPTGPVVLLVVTDDTSPTAQELARQGLIESWDCQVTLISDDAAQAEFDAAISEADVAYVGPSISGGALAHKLTGKLDNFGLCSGTFNYVNGDTVLVVDNSHHITSVFSLGSLTVSAAAFDMSIASGTLAPDLQNLAEIAGYPAVAALETGAQRFDGGTAPARRVHLPYVNADVSSMTADAQTMMQRAIDWAAGMETVCGDAECAVGEECDCPADCGPPVASEVPGSTCDDGMDNDCDGATDCDDINCPADLTCSCSNGNCDPSEDCNTCPADCLSKTSGKPSSQYCCGNGIAESAEGDGTICDGNY